MATTGRERKAVQFKGIAERLEEFGKLGLGTMVHPETACWCARSILFLHMEKTLADDLQELRDSSLPLYRALLERGRKMLPGDHSDFPAMVIQDVLPNNATRARLHYVQSWASLKQAAEHSTAAKELMTAVSEWTGARHMIEDWFLDSILGNLCVWCKSPEAGMTLRWSYTGSLAEGKDHRVGPDAKRLHGWGTLDHRLAVPAVKPYNPSTQTRVEYQRELQLEFDRYCALQEDVFAEAEFEQTVRKRARTSDSPSLHFDWFIEYQIQERSGPQIAQKYKQGKIGEDAIHHALRDLAGVLQVTLRPRARQQQQPELRKKR
jgi:hypothetical protein